MNFCDFQFETKLWNKSLSAVAGIDEVGRGCFAGPVVAGACVFPSMSSFTSSFITKSGKKVDINDSKKLSTKKRVVADQWIKENAFSWGIGEVNVDVINKIGIGKATILAFKKAVEEVNKRMKGTAIDHLLIDAFFIPYLDGLPKGKQTSIVKGDQKSISIASASIIAKVYRDSLMEKLSLDPKYKIYNWGQNKGYGTHEHCELIRTHGISPLHRVAFVNTFLEKSSRE